MSMFWNYILHWCLWSLGWSCPDMFRLLPPANEFWGKVIFSEACDSHSVKGLVGGGGALSIISLSVWEPGPMFFLVRLSLVPCSFQRGSLSRVGGSLSREGGLYPEQGSLLKGVSLQGGYTSKDYSVGRPGDLPNQKSGRYVSYWNAVLFWSTSIIILYLLFYRNSTRRVWFEE